MSSDVEGEKKLMVWWVALGYPSFEEGKDGFPRTGQVVKHYRENKMNDAGKAWTQIKLAKELKVTHVTVGEIENLDTNLGVDRRQRLCQLLDIPPILLGIRTRAEVLKMVEERRAEQGASIGTSSGSPSPWWVELGYPEFAPGEDGFFPRTGQVVKYYRGRAMETKSKLWTQGGLAKALNLESDQTIWELETKDTALDFERRQFLCRLFDIPPILFGIMSLDEIEKLVEQKGGGTAPVSIISTRVSTAHKLLIDVEEYTFLLNSYWTTFLRNPTRISMTNIDLCIDALYRELPHVREKKPLQELLCRFHNLVANILLDWQKYDEALVHLEKALRFAQQRNKDELKAAVLYDYGYALRQVGRLDKALRKYKQARHYEQRLPRNLWGALLLETGRAEAHVAQTPEKKKAAITLVDRVGTIVRSKEIEEDPYFLGLNLDHYHLARSASLIAVGRNRDGINELKHVEVAPEHPRRQMYYNIYRAQAHANLGEYSEAADFAASGLVIAQGSNSVTHISRVEHIYKQFPQELFKSDPDVARLEYLLTMRKTRARP